MVRVLVTGGTGFIGSNLVKALYKRGDEVICVGREEENDVKNFCQVFIDKPFYDLDWKAIDKIDILFHLAAVVDTTIRDEKQMIFVNSEAAIELFKKAILNGCKKIVYASSTAVYGNSPAPFVEGVGENPLNAYGKSKLILDKKAMELAKEYLEVKIIGLRYCNVFGPGERHKGKNANMVYQLAQQILHDKPRIFKNGEQKRDQIYVKDVISANLCALNAKESCVVNCGSGKSVSFNEMVKVLNEVLGMKKEIEYIDNPYESFFQTHTECDMKKAREKIGFMPEFSFR
mgnify:FL=1